MYKPTEAVAVNTGLSRVYTRWGPGIERISEHMAISLTQTLFTTSNLKMEKLVFSSEVCLGRQTTLEASLHV